MRESSECVCVLFIINLFICVLFIFFPIIYDDWIVCCFFVLKLALTDKMIKNCDKVRKKSLCYFLDEVWKKKNFLIYLKGVMKRLKVCSYRFFLLSVTLKTFNGFYVHLTTLLWDQEPSLMVINDFCGTNDYRTIFLVFNLNRS